MLFFSLKTPLMRNADRKRPRAPASLKAFSSLLPLNGLSSSFQLLGLSLVTLWVQGGAWSGVGGWGCLLPWGEKFLGANLQGVCLSTGLVSGSCCASRTGCDTKGDRKDGAPALSLQGDHVFTGTGGHGKPDCGRPFLSAP